MVLWGEAGQGRVYGDKQEERKGKVGCRKSMTEVR